MSGVLEGLLNDSVGSGRDCVQALMQELGVQKAQQLETVPYHQLAQAYRNVSPALKAKGANVGQSPHPNRFYLGDPLQNGSGFRPETADIPVLIGTVYSEFYGFFDGLKGVRPEEAVGLSAAETLREQFHCLPAPPGGRPAAGRYQLPRPTIKYVRERAKAGGKVYSYLFDQDFPLMRKSTPWHCADIPFVFHNTELVPVCAFEGAKAAGSRNFWRCDAVCPYRCAGLGCQYGGCGTDHAFRPPKPSGAEPRSCTDPAGHRDRWRPASGRRCAGSATGSCGWAPACPAPRPSRPSGPRRPAPAGRRGGQAQFPDLIFQVVEEGPEPDGRHT